MLRDYDDSVDTTHTWIRHMQRDWHALDAGHMQRDWHALDAGYREHSKMMCSIYIDPCYEQHAGMSGFIDMPSIA